MSMSFRSCLLAGLLLLAAACGNSSQKPGGATGPDYEGEPLFVVSGELTGTNPPRGVPIRLAVSWYPDQSANSAPKAIVTQDVQYQGSFPLNYTFSFFAPPPPGAFTEYTEGGQTYRVAWGTLLAYGDGNDNGTLDVIPVGGSPIDNVLGSAIGDHYNGKPAAEPAYVAYVDGAVPAGWTGYQPGYNLVKGAQVVPATTPVPIPLDATNELNFLVCEELMSGQSQSLDLPCNIPPTGGVRVAANLFSADGMPGASVRVTDGTQVLTNAVVELNGKVVPFEAQYGLYYGFGGALTWNAPGQNELRVTVPGKAPIVLSPESTGEFQLTAPGDQTLLLPGGSVAASWTAAQGATFYLARAYDAAVTGNGAIVHEEYLTAGTLQATVGPLPHESLYGVDVLAFGPKATVWGMGASMANAAMMHTRYVEVVANAPWLSGSVSVTRMGGTDYPGIWLEAKDGLTPLGPQDAQVSVNGQNLGWSQQFQMFTHLAGTLPLTPGAAATLAVSVPGKPATTVSVTLPGAMQLQQPLPASLAQGTPLPLAWTASTGAEGYQVAAYDEQSNLLFAQSTQATQLTVPGFSQPGDVYVRVDAFAYGSSMHLSSSFGLVETVTVSP